MIKFADEALIEVSSGKGGNGCIAFRREKYVPRGGPAGGDGGRGGDVIFEVKRNMRTLAHLRYKQVFKARNGSDGEGRNRYGSDGEDIIINIPPGTIIKDAETGKLIYDFGAEGIEQHFLFLIGGKGGWGNSHFKSSTNQAPRYAHDGKPGETRKLRIELNILADIGLVGLPNAGKSSLLDYYTNARPKIAPYPFTTKIPNLGVLRVDEEYDIIIADIPGIIEGASEGVGLGIRFLKHISRTQGLVCLIDLSDEGYLESLDTILVELENFSPLLIKKPRIICANKLDVEGTLEKLQLLQEKYPTETIYGMSIYSGEGMDIVKNALIGLVDTIQKEDTNQSKTKNDFVEKSKFLEERSTDGLDRVDYPGKDF